MGKCDIRFWTYLIDKEEEVGEEQAIGNKVIVVS